MAKGGLPNARNQLQTYIHDLIEHGKLIGISENQVKSFVDYLIPKDASRISRVGPGRQDDRFFVRAESKATRGNRDGNNNGKIVKREPYKRVGVPRIALDHFIRNGCQRDAMSNEIPHIVRVPFTKKCSNDNPKQVFNPKTNRCVTVERYGTKTGDFMKYFSAYPSGNVPLNVQYPLQFAQDNWWTNDDLLKPAQIPAGRPGHLRMMLDTFNQVYTCEDLRDKFKDKENQPWQDLHSPEKLQAIFDAWASGNVSNSNHNSAWSRSHNNVNIKREDGINTKLTGNAVLKRSRSNTSGSSTPRQSSKQRNNSRKTQNNAKSQQKVLNPNTNRYVNADGRVARSNGIGIYANKGASGSQNRTGTNTNQTKRQSQATGNQSKSQRKVIKLVLPSRQNKKRNTNQTNKQSKATGNQSQPRNPARRISNNPTLQRQMKNHKRQQEGRKK